MIKYFKVNILCCIILLSIFLSNLHIYKTIVKSKDLNKEEILQDMLILDLENPDDDHVSIDSIYDSDAVVPLPVVRLNLILLMRNLDQKKCAHYLYNLHHS